MKAWLTGGENMASSPIVGNTSDIIKANEASKLKTSGNGNLGKDEFLKILIAQLKNQDPTQPLQDKEFIAQMAQFTSVEQLTNMAGEMKTLRQSLGFASGLIGKIVSWEGRGESGNSEIRTGIVDSITFKNGEQFANVEGEEISLSKLVKIENSGETT
jgi:flagellar basal-body rod modification protein FlgD